MLAQTFVPCPCPLVIVFSPALATVFVLYHVLQSCGAGVTLPCCSLGGSSL